MDTQIPKYLFMLEYRDVSISSYFPKMAQLFSKKDRILEILCRPQRILAGCKIFFFKKSKNNSKQFLFSKQFNSQGFFSNIMGLACMIQNRRSTP